VITKFDTFDGTTHTKDKSEGEFLHNFCDLNITNIIVKK